MIEFLISLPPTTAPSGYTRKGNSAMRHIESGNKVCTIFNNPKYQVYKGAANPLGRHPLNIITKEII